MSRPDLPKFRQQPWAVYGQIEWEGRVFKRGMLVSNLILPRALKYFRNFFFPNTCCSKEINLFDRYFQVKITKTVPYFYGTIKRFLLYGDHDCDVYATGGDIEVVQVNQKTKTFDVVVRSHQLLLGRLRSCQSAFHWRYKISS